MSYILMLTPLCIT